MSDKTVGIAISTYIGEHSPPCRKDIAIASIYSLIASNFTGKIVLVDDASIDKSVVNIFKSDSRVTIVEREQNVGYSKCKNHGLYMVKDCDYIFLADDDILYNGNWWEMYIEASNKTGIPHFSFYDKKNLLWDVVPYNGTTIKKTPMVNGVLLFMTKELVRDIGGYIILPHKYGHEHSNYTYRCVAHRKIPYFCDISNSEDYINIIESSRIGRSTVIDLNEQSVNGGVAFTDLSLFQPIEY